MNQDILIRNLKIRDLISLYRAYRKLSPTSKLSFRPDYFNPLKGIRCFVTSVYFFLSTIKPIKVIMKKYYPQAEFLCLIATNKSEVVGMSHLKISRQLSDKSFSATFGVFIVDKYQNRGLGSLLVKLAIEQAEKEGILAISLTVLQENKRAIYLYEKFGFKITEERKDADLYEGEYHTVYEMRLNLRRGDK